MIYDVIVIGTGPAGLTAALYSKRYKLNTLVIGKEIGGYLPETPLIENYPGYKEISGIDLAKNMYEQIQDVEVRIEDEVKELRKEKEEFIVKTEKETFFSKTVILAPGSQRRKLNVEGEAEFVGKGVTYCVLCDGPFFREKEIAIIGGGDSAISAARYMLKYANKIYMIDIEEKPRAKALSLEQLKKEGQDKIEFYSSHKVNRIKGDKFVNAIEIEEVEWQGKEIKATGRTKQLEVAGVIIEVGVMPSSNLAKQIGAHTDNSDFIIVDEEMRTNIPGLFAAGDITNRSLKQIITAAAQGAIAAFSAYSYLKSKKP